MDVVTYALAKKQIESAVDPFIVNLTPTAQDFSGTMDKTVAEITEAYEAGRKIVFRSWMSETRFMDTDCTARWNLTEYRYPSFNAFTLDNNTNILIFAYTGATNYGERTDYGTVLYTLTRVT